MVVPAMQLASKIPDMSVQLWSSALLKGLSFFFFNAELYKLLTDVCVRDVPIDRSVIRINRFFSLTGQLTCCIFR